MHSILFSIKRAFHKSTAFSRNLLARTDVPLTPSRFEVLLIIEHAGVFQYRQCDLRRDLGVAASTVSRFLRALESLGLVIRTRSIVDHRQRMVELTAEGRRIVRRAAALLLAWGTMHFLVENMIVVQWTWAGRLEVMEALDDTLKRMRRWLGDTARLVYRWHPED
jgi:DNA-binding MarR family transcriptional regulator